MLKVLIVDDEPYVRQYLESIIDWEKYGFYICDEAANGKEALEMIRLHSPNLVITDIKMPEIDGLELIRIAVKEMQVSAKFIILSGYDDFSYAKTAIKYNVMDYIVKPIEEKELLELLTKLNQEIYSEMAKDEETSISARALASDTIKRLVEGEINDNVLLYARRWLNLKEEEETYYMLAEIENYDEWLSTLSEDERLRSSQLIENIIFKAIGLENVLNVQRELVYRYGILVGKHMLSKFNHSVKVFAERLYQDFVRDGKLKVTLCVGAGVYTLSDIEKSYKTCHEINRNSLFNADQCKIIHYDDREDESFTYDASKINYFQILQEDIENNRQDAIRQNIENLFLEIREKQIAPNLIKALIIKFEFDIFASCMNISQWKREANVLSGKLLFPDSNESCIRDIKRSLIEFCIECANYIKLLKENKSNGILCDIEAYILKNFKSDISLKSIGEVFFINPVYLGQLFKKKFGMYFNDYLHKLRIDEAMRLLKISDLKIYEIAYMVGYTDHAYFGSKFEKVAGMSPTQYRKSVYTQE